MYGPLSLEGDATAEGGCAVPRSRHAPCDLEVAGELMTDQTDTLAVHTVSPSPSGVNACCDHVQSDHQTSLELMQVQVEDVSTRRQL